MKRFGLIFLALLVSAMPSATKAEENYTFDLSEIEKSPIIFQVTSKPNPFFTV